MRIPRGHWHCPPGPPLLVWPLCPARVTWRLYNRAVAAAPLPTFAASPQKFPQTPGASLISVRLRGTFPLGPQEFILRTTLSCVRGPHLRFAAFRRMTCVAAILCCKTIMSFATAPFFAVFYIADGAAQGGGTVRYNATDAQRRMIAVQQSVFYCSLLLNSAHKYAQRGFPEKFSGKIRNFLLGTGLKICILYTLCVF